MAPVAEFPVLRSAAHLSKGIIDLVIEEGTQPSYRAGSRPHDHEIPLQPFLERAMIETHVLKVPGSRPHVDDRSVLRGNPERCAQHGGPLGVIRSVSSRHPEHSLKESRNEYFDRHGIINALVRGLLSIALGSTNCFFSLSGAAADILALPSSYVRKHEGTINREGV